MEDAPGCVTEDDIYSPEDLPAYSRSTVDGYAVKAADTFGCSEALPAMLLYDGEIRIGETPQQDLLKGHCMKIPTGGTLPSGADAVCMVEYTEDIGDEYRYLYKPIPVLENVNSQGDDSRKDSLLLAKGTMIRAKHIAILAALGIAKVRVFRKIRVGVLSTGDELVEYQVKPQGSQIRNINSVMLASQILEAGAEPILYPIVRDDLPELEKAVSRAISECDLILISGGSSVGEKDHTYQVLETLGEILFHGISIKPGKPTLFALIHDKPVLGLPGHPQAAFFAFRLFVMPALWKLMGNADPYQERIQVCTLIRSIPSDHGREEIIPVKIREGAAEPLPAAEPVPIAEPLPAKSGVVSVLSGADGYIRIARNTEGLAAGTAVNVYLL